MLLHAHPPKLCQELCSGHTSQGRTQKILLIPSVKFSCSVLSDSWRCPSNLLGFPYSSVSKESACNAGDLGSIPRLGRSPGEGNGNLLQYYCLENPMDRGAWLATVHRVARVGHDLAILLLVIPCASLVAQRLKRLPAMRETWVRSLDWEDPLEKMPTHSSILAWRIPWSDS